MAFSCGRTWRSVATFAGRLEVSSRSRSGTDRASASTGSSTFTPARPFHSAKTWLALHRRRLRTAVTSPHAWEEDQNDKAQRDHGRAPVGPGAGGRRRGPGGAAFALLPQAHG